MRWIFYSPISFEPWDWRNSVESGIGGSETSHVEMAWRMARRGHEVITYAPVPWEHGERRWRGTVWRPTSEADWTLKGTWVLYRCPDVLDRFSPRHPGKTLWLMHQDWDYPTLRGRRLRKLDKLLLLCQWHKRYTIRRHPEVADKILVTSNGLKTDLIQCTESAHQTYGDPIIRNPKKIMYASSPDRGLKPLLLAFRKAREYVPDLELHTFYGFNNIDTWIKDNPKHPYGKIKEELLRLSDFPGVVSHGRVTQQELYRQWLSAGLWCYPTNFHETSCITCMEAQGMGAIPITSPIAALEENVQWGTFIQGDAWNDPLLHATFAMELVRWSTDAALQESIRPSMMAWARQQFDWERFVTQWIEEAGGRRTSQENGLDSPTAETDQPAEIARSLA